MLMPLLSVVAGAVLGMVAGMLWYSPLLFGKQWMKLMNLKDADFEKKKKSMNMTLTYGSSFMAMIVEAFVVRLFWRYIGVETFPQAVVMAGWLWIGFMAPVMMSTVLYGGKSMKLFWLDAGYQLLVVILMSVTITALA